DWLIIRVKLGKLAEIIARWVASADLQILSEPDSCERAIELFFEDLTSKRFNAQRVFGRLVGNLGIRINNIDDALQAIDTDGNKPVEVVVDGDGHKIFATARQEFIKRMRGNASFHDPRIGHKY